MARAFAKHPAVAWLVRYHRATRETTTTALAVMPLILLYGIGLLFSHPGARSAVDPVSAPLMTMLPTDGLIAVYVGLAGAILVTVTCVLRSRTPRRLALTAPLIGEATVYGLTLGGLIALVLDELHVLAAGPVSATQLLDCAVASAGAGLLEELLFRLLLLSALTWLLVRQFQLPRGAAVVIAVMVSSIAFAAAHHVAGEPVALYPLAYRTLAGLLFAGLFLTRGFAVAAWAHATYDFYVLLP